MKVIVESPLTLSMSWIICQVQPHKKQWVHIHTHTHILSHDHRPIFISALAISFLAYQLSPPPATSASRQPHESPSISIRTVFSVYALTTPHPGDEPRCLSSHPWICFLFSCLGDIPQQRRPVPFQGASALSSNSPRKTHFSQAFLG